VSSRDEIQAKLFLLDCKMWAKIFSMAAEDLGEVVIDQDKKLTAQVLSFATGKRIYSMSSNPDAQAGKRGGRVLDEFALGNDPRMMWSIAYPGLTWGGSMEVVSTHRGSENFFNQLIREILEKKNPKRISHHKVTLQNALEQGFLFKLQQALPEDAEQQEMDEAEYFDFIKNGCADEESFLQEYMCVPGDDQSAFLEYDLIAKSEYKASDQWELDSPEDCKGKILFGGIDIGRTKDLTVLWILELLGDVLYTRKVIELRNMSKPDQEKVLWPWVNWMMRTCQDYSGLGIGWGDDAQLRYGQYRYENITFSAKIKEFLAYPVRGKMEDGKLRIPFAPEVRADLRAVTKEATPTGNIRFTAERSENGHADRFWALALAIHAAGNFFDDTAILSGSPRETTHMMENY
jgi:phage FluMu gp28-like protein